MNPEPARYSVAHREPLCEFVVRGPVPRVVSLFFNAVQSLSGTPGLALVQLTEPPREWVTGAVSKPALLRGLLEIRDLLGTRHLDAAVFSPSEALELHLDRLATLEGRAGDWQEASWAEMFQRAGFERVEQLAPLPEDAASKAPSAADPEARIARVVKELGLLPPAD